MKFEATESFFFIIFLTFSKRRALVLTPHLLVYSAWSTVRQRREMRLLWLLLLLSYKHHSSTKGVLGYLTWCCWYFTVQMVREASRGENRVHGGILISKSNGYV